MCLRYLFSRLKYGKDQFPIYLNVGRGINDGKYHIYDITNKIRDTADRINGLERPKPNEGYALTSGISKTSIRNSGESVNKKVSGKARGVYYTTKDGKAIPIDQAEKNGKLALKDKQSVAAKTAKFLQRLGVGSNYYFFESYVDQKGHRVFKDRFGNIQAAPNGLYYSDGDINIDINAGTDSHSITLRTLSHELTHMIQQWSAAKYKGIADFLAEQYDKEGRSAYEAAKAKQAELSELRGKRVSFQEAYHEFVADSMSTMFDDGNLYDILTDLKKKDKTIFDYIKKFFDGLAAKVRNLYANTRAETDEGQFVQGLSKETVYHLQQMFADALVDAGENYAASEQKNTDTQIGVQYMDRIERLADADVLELIENCNRGEYALRTYIPVRRDTPNILLDRSQREGLKPLDNRPIIMLVEHVQQCMDDEVAANDGKRGHALTAQNILDITKALDSPRYIFYQKDNGKYSMLVEYDIGNRNEKGLAIVDVTRDKNPDQMNGFEGGKYNILVTAYAPESAYLKKYIKSENNICIYDKTEDASQRSSGSLVPSLLNESSSNRSLAQREPVVKKNDSSKFAAAALKHFGRTFSWKETGYLLTDGVKLDFSGRHEGAAGGYRTVDHRDIRDIYLDDADMDGNAAMVDFMRQGNIRIMPEGDGINLQVQPTRAQEIALEDFISRARGEVTLDIDDTAGNTVVSVEYPRGTRASKVLQDIRKFFTDGTEPTVSDLAWFRYQDRAAAPSNRAQLAQALEGVAANVEDYQTAQEYRQIAPLLDAEEAKLSRLNAQIRELTFGKGSKDREKLAALRLEAKQTQNRIDIYDRQLLKLEAAAPIRRVLEREKAKAYKKAAEKGKEAVRRSSCRAPQQETGGPHLVPIRQYKKNSTISGGVSCVGIIYLPG